MAESRDSSFYLKVIEGFNDIQLLDMFSDEPEALRESLVLNHAFDMLVELGDVSVCDHLVSYLNDELDMYCYKKGGAITVLGELGVKKHESLIEKYLDSKNQHLSYNALCSMCGFLERKELSKEATDRFVLRLVNTLTHLECSKEEALECALALYSIDHDNLGELLDNCKRKYSEFWDDYRSFVSNKKRRENNQL